MIVIVDERETVREAFASLFDREGVSTVGLNSADLENWIATAQQPDLLAIEAFLLGELPQRQARAKAIRARSVNPLLAVIDGRSLEETLDLFAAGVDDVVRKPVHVRELLARIRAIQRRTGNEPDCITLGPLRIFTDGRDPEIDGEILVLPRRERRILEYLAINRGCRVTKTHLFNSVYGLFRDEIDENVIESHISKLRKRLRQKLGFDPIDSKRFLGYRLGGTAAEQAQLRPTGDTSPAQVAHDLTPLFDVANKDTGNESLRHADHGRLGHASAG